MLINLLIFLITWKIKNNIIKKMKTIVFFSESVSCKLNRSFAILKNELLEDIENFQLLFFIISCSFVL